MSDTERHRLGLIAIVMWAIVAVWVPTQREFDWTQDVEAYATNIERALYLGQEVRDETKVFYYSFIVLPLWEVIQDVELTLVALKCLTSALFLVAIRKRLSNSLDAILVIAFIAFAPVFSENLHEYLRQGMGIAVLLLAFSFSAKIIRWPLIVLAVLIHNVVALVMVCLVVGVYLGQRAFADDAEVNPRLLRLGVAGLVIAGVCGFVGGQFIRALPLGRLSGYLVGERANMLAVLFLLSYATYLGWRSLADRSVPHVAAYLGLVVLCAAYQVTVDFGRALSLVMPLHLVAAMSLFRQRDRVADLGAAVVVGSILFLA